MWGGPFRAVLAVLLVCLLAGCGGGGGGGGGGSVTTSTPSGSSSGGSSGGSGLLVFGNAAEGPAISNAEVTLVDANGDTRTTSTDGQGAYAIDVGGMTGPFLIRVRLDNGRHLYSISFEPGRANINEITHFVMEGIAESLVFNLESAFQTPAWAESLSPESVLIVQALVQEALYAHLSDAGVEGIPDFRVDPWDEDLPVDDVLGSSTVEDDGTFTIRGPDGRVSHCSFRLKPPETLVIRVSIERSNGGGTTVEEFSSLVPTRESVLVESFDGVLRRLDHFRDVLLNHAAGLVAGNFAEDLAADFIHDGVDGIIFAAQLATRYRGCQVRYVEPVRITTHDPAHGTIESLIRVSYLTPGGGLRIDLLLMAFRREPDGSWRMVGNRRNAECLAGGLRGRKVTTTGAEEKRAILLEVLAPPQRDVQSVKVQLEGLGEVTLTRAGTRTSHLEPEPGVGFDVILDIFRGEVALASDGQPPVEPARFILTDGSAVETTFHVPVAGLPDEVTELGLSGSSQQHLPAGALGQLATVTWKLPRHFPVARVDLHALVHNVNDDTETVTDPPVTPFDESASMVLPTLCNGLAVTRVELILLIHGFDGQVEAVRGIWEVVP